MADYELCCEIFNQCSNNQMRDISFEEVSVDDPDEYVRSTEPQAEIEKETLSNGTLIFNTNSAGLRKRYSFTPI